VSGMKGAILQFEDDVERNREDLMRYAKARHGQERSGIRDAPEAWVGRFSKTKSPNEDVHLCVACGERPRLATLSRCKSCLKRMPRAATGLPGRKLATALPIP
jgi:hypothetical protein